MPKQKKTVKTQEYKLISVDPKDVAFNNENPRGESAEQINADPEFNQLVDSVYRFGVLVPIVICRQNDEASGKRYSLIDGERRLRAALKTNRAKIPAHVANREPSVKDLIQAFHIHMLRKQWGRTAQTRALKLILKESTQNSSDLFQKGAFIELQALTGYTKTQLSSLLQAAKYPDSVLDDVDNKLLSWSFLVQFEVSVIEPIKQHFPDLFKEFGVHELRNILLRKAKRKVLSGTRALMENIVPVIARAQGLNEKTFAEKLLRDFLNTDDMTAESVLGRFDLKFPESQTGLLDLLDRSIEKAESLEHMLQTLPGPLGMLSYPAKTKELYSRLDALRTLISKKRRTHKTILE
ncbi:MAG: ParB N-terminal domain-containing protein [bacterium]